MPERRQRLSPAEMAERAYPSQSRNAPVGSKSSDNYPKATFMRNRLVRIVTAAIVGLSVGETIKYGLIESRMKSTPSAQEVELGNGVYDAVFSDSRLRVSCEPDDSFPEGKGAYVQKDYVLQRMIPIIHIRQELCDAASEYANSPDKNSPSHDEVAALDTLAHEGEHLAQADGNEARTECRAVQRVAQLAIAFGANGIQAMEVRGIDIVDYFRDEPPAYQTDQCYDSGPLDLDPDTHDAFPYRLAG